MNKKTLAKVLDISFIDGQNQNFAERLRQNMLAVYGYDSDNYFNQMISVSDLLELLEKTSKRQDKAIDKYINE
jgi:hypothetical protein